MITLFGAPPPKPRPVHAPRAHAATEITVAPGTAFSSTRIRRTFAPAVLTAAWPLRQRIDQ
jgi:hypothetical protein